MALSWTRLHWPAAALSHQEDKVASKMLMGVQQDGETSAAALDVSYWKPEEMQLTAVNWRLKPEIMILKKNVLSAPVHTKRFTPASFHSARTKLKM